MAKTRMINTSFWSDSFIQELDPSTKLFFLYLLTNEHTDICGIYEISIKTMEFESGMKKDAVSKAIDRLSKANKISYSDNWVFIKNFGKHQQNNPKVQRGIEIGLERVPKAIYDRLSIDYGGLSHSNSNSNSNSNLNPNLNSNGGVEKNLVKWFSSMEDVSNPKGLCKKYLSLYSESVIERSLKNQTCTSRNKFVELCEHYNEKT